MKNSWKTPDIKPDDQATCLVLCRADDPGGGYYDLATYSAEYGLWMPDDADVCFGPGVVSYWQEVEGPDGSYKISH